MPREKERCGCGSPFGAAPMGRVVRAGKSVSTSGVGAVTRDMAVSGGTGSLPAHLLHPLSIPGELLRAGNYIFPCGKGWGIAAPLKLMWGLMMCPKGGGREAAVPTKRQ